VNKPAVRAFVLGCIIVVSLLAAHAVNATSKTIKVPEDYPTVAEAIGNATEGDTILVRNGTYQEQAWEINKALTLTGENANGTKIIFYPPQSSRNITANEPTFGNAVTFPLPGDIVDVNASGVKFSGFTLSTESGGFRIDGNEIQIVGNFIGAPIWGRGDGIQIIGNTLDWAELHGSNQTFAQNIVGDSVDCEGSYNNVTANEVGNPQQYIQRGYEPYYLHPSIVVRGSFNVVFGNNITVGGLELKGNENTASDNNVTSAIWVEGTNNNLQSNTIKHGGFIIGGNGNIFWENNVAGNNILGDRLKYDLSMSPIYDSLVSEPYVVSMGALDEFDLEDAVNNTFYHNNFVGANQIRLWDGAKGPNFWDNGVEGNYWSDYNGTDANHDGIGDTPYLIDTRDRDYQPQSSEAAKQDNYPLMAPFGNCTLNVELPDKSLLTPSQSPSQSMDAQTYPSPTALPTATTQPNQTSEPTPPESYPPAQQPTTKPNQQTTLQESYYGGALVGVVVIVAAVVLILRNRYRNKNQV
jgi:hypothetical protein